MRLIKTALVLPISLIALSLLGGCNGSSDDSSGGGGENSGEYALSLSYKTVVDGQCAEATNDLSFSSNASICVVANLTQGGKASSGGLVSFSASLGTISPATKLTNSSGLAEVILTPVTGTQGAGTVTAQFDTKAAENNILSVERNYEFVDNGTTPTDELPKVSASIQLGAASITRFKVDETVQLQAQFLDPSSVGIAGQLVTFTAGSVTLNPDTALTNSQGIAQVSYTPTDSELGAANLNVSITYKDQNYQSNSLYEVLSSDAIDNDGVLKLGHFDANNQFVEGKLATTLAPKDGKYIISAGGSLGITASLISQANDGTITRIQTPSSISFSSDCVSSNNASLDTPVTTLSGDASSTFQDTSCSGNSERDDIITASTLAGNQTLTASLPFTLERQTLANIGFVSADPTSIRIKGAGGTGTSESSLVTFKVTSANGQPTAQQEVSFTLDTVVGGLSFANGLSTAEGLTNSAGVASVRVLSGTVPTPVRVVASATDADTGEVITTQSEQLTVNTGLPQQLGFSLSTSVSNPEAGDFDGETASITAYASDSFGNPAPDDTVIQFTSEGGQIEPKCLTQNGTCSVTWTSASPRVPDHRITVLAYALGHETFFDTNGNNVFDTNDYETVKDSDGNDVIKTYLACLNNQGMEKACTGNGMDVEAYLPKGLSDLPDAFRDDNENGIYELGEKYFNTKNTPEYMMPDGKFNGPQCEGDYCGVSTYIRKALVMTMSGSDADFTVYQDSVQIYSTATGLGNVTSIPVNGSSNFTVRFYDNANQIMPAGSNAAISATNGTLAFNGYTVPSGNSHGGTQTSFGLSHDGETALSQVSISLTTPLGTTTTLTIPVQLL